MPAQCLHAAPAAIARAGGSGRPAPAARHPAFRAPLSLRPPVPAALVAARRPAVGRRATAPLAPRAGGAVTELADTAAYDAWLAEHKDRLVVIDFFTSWCGPCKMIAPKVEKMAEELTDIRFAKINLENCPREFAVGLGVKSLPTFVAYRGGEKLGQFVGANAKGLRDFVFCHV